MGTVHFIVHLAYIFKYFHLSSTEKAYDVTYVRLRFHSPRPESFAIYKKTTEDSEWIPYQFYSASCERTYGLEHRGIITSDNEDQPVCTDEYSNISPLTGGSVAFSTLEGRPSAFNFESSHLLQVGYWWMVKVWKFECKVLRGVTLPNGFMSI